MKKVILFMAGILASMMLNAQSRWSVTPEAGLVVNKENEGTSVTLGFKAGAGVLYQLKEGVGKKPSFGLKSGVYILMQKGGYHRLSGNFWLVSFKISYLCLPLFHETRTTPSCHPSGCAYRQL